MVWLSDILSLPVFLVFPLAKKWLWCSWRHRAHHCHPTVWGPELARQLGVDYYPDYWHCAKCHPCGEDLDRLIDSILDEP